MSGKPYSWASDVREVFHAVNYQAIPIKNLGGMGGAKCTGRGYSLALADGSRWWIGADSSQQAWVNRLAELMQLDPGDPVEDACRFFLTKANEGEMQLLREASGWSLVNLNRCLIRQHSESPDILWEIGPEVSEASSPLPFFLYLSTFIHRESLRRGGLPFHAAMVEKGGQGIILAGPSGAGKSTCFRRIPPPWQGLCDDELLVVKTPEGRYLAHPFPTWSDEFLKRQNRPRKVQSPVPLAGIFFLEQASSDDYLAIKAGEAAVAATASAFQVMDRLFWVSSAKETRNLRCQIFANACDLVGQIPTFRLKVSLNGRFWEKLEAALGWQ